MVLVEDLTVNGIASGAGGGVAGVLKEVSYEMRV